ncbi:hypothetical protein F6476_17520 [Pseudomonas umsongensis]|uniref:hypothetical protein n=1 Tax=Pseudomonas umsongensis TaxID=198618 RepID=UPI0012493A0E|nr:hypothetical protein [Pseudomonas umsongensis]MBT9573172.1 hypothetical protein [Pseudomonas umsongensis]QFG30845.1 hypothetical protein F6476_17520 [Pseudomonas umsongensis]
MNLRSLIVAVLVVLAGCVTAPPAPVEVPQIMISPSTWQQVDREIVDASQSATEQAKIYAHGAMDYWRTRVYQLTEENFIPWFSSYWTQEWLSMKVSWYTISAKGEQDATEKRLAAYLLEKYQEKVLAPAALEVDPDAILTLAAAFYLDIMKEELQKISQRHGVPMAQLNGRIRKVPAIALGPPPARDASLYQVVHAEQLSALPAYAALVDKVHKAGGDKGVGSTDTAMAPVAKRASQRIEAEMAPRGAASAVAAAAGKLAGALISVGVAGVRAIIQANDRPDSEALIRSSLGNTFDKAWTKLLQNPTTGVMAGTLYMASQIEGSLAQSAQPSVGTDPGSVDWSPTQSTNQQINP